MPFPPSYLLSVNQIDNLDRYLTEIPQGKLREKTNMENEQMRWLWFPCPSTHDRGIWVYTVIWTTPSNNGTTWAVIPGSIRKTPLTRKNPQRTVLWRERRKTPISSAMADVSTGQRNGQQITEGRSCCTSDSSIQNYAEIGTIIHRPCGGPI